MILSNRYHFFTLCLLFIFSPFSLAQDLQLLRDVREEITFEDLTLREKTLLVEQTQQLFKNLYVNRLDKLAFYPELDDQLAVIDTLLENIENTSTRDMELQLFNIYASQRDLHLNYVFPSPHNRYLSLLPLTFARTLEKPYLPENKVLKYSKVRVSAVNAELFARYAESQQVPAIGDTLIAYNHKPVKQAIEDRVVLSQGANAFGGFARAMASLTFLPHLLVPVPEEDEVTMTFIASGKGRHKRGQQYTITLPWLTQVPERAGARSATAGALNNNTQKLTREDFFQGKDLWQEIHLDALSRYNLQRETAYPNNPSLEPELSWGVIDNEFGSFGYLRLNSFVPLLGNDLTIAEIQRLLAEELADTQGLIFDIRNNGGGSVDLANRLYQLFSATPIETMGGRPRNSDINRSLLNNTLLGLVFGEAWVNNINDAQNTESELTATALFTDPSIDNQLGQFYYKPVAVLANANSYSASDLFACSMQDNRAALLFGEEPRTGAGGANVFEYDIFNFLSPFEFPPLPTDHRLRVAWGQIVRVGPNAGEIIEDFGCRADVNVSPSKFDLLNNNQEQIETITQALFFKSFAPRYQSTVIPSTYLNTQLAVGGTASYRLDSKKTKLIKIYKNDQLLETRAVYSGFKFKTSEITVDKLEAGSTRLTFEGIDYRGKTTWNVKRNFLVFDGETVAVGERGFEKQFSDGSLEPLTIFNNQPDELGWQLVDDALQVGFAPQYSNNTSSSAAAVFDLSALERASLELDFEFDTEANFDFVSVIAEDGDGNRRVLFRGSGFSPRQNLVFDLADFAGQDQVIVRFNFDSDFSVTAPGAKIYRFSVN